MKNESGIDLSGIKRTKAYFSSGKPSLILKLKLPRAECENEAFNLKFNAFYKELLDILFKLGEKFASDLGNLSRPASLTVESRQKSTPGCKIIIIRSIMLRLPDEASKICEYIDIFDAGSGLFIEEKKKHKINKSLHNKKKPSGE